MQLLSSPLFGLRDIKERLPSFLSVIREFMLLMRNVRPQEINSGFQMLSALIQQVNIRGILDI